MGKRSCCETTITVGQIVLNSSLPQSSEKLQHIPKPGSNFLRAGAPLRTSFFENRFESGWDKELRAVLYFRDCSTPISRDDSDIRYYSKRYAVLADIYNIVINP